MKAIRRLEKILDEENVLVQRALVQIQRARDYEQISQSGAEILANAQRAALHLLFLSYEIVKEVRKET